MKDHLTKFWSLYAMAIAAVAPFFPFINGAITQEVGPHAHLKSIMMSISLWLAHRAAPPSSVA